MNDDILLARRKIRSPTRRLLYHFDVSLRDVDGHAIATSGDVRTVATPKFGAGSLLINDITGRFYSYAQPDVSGDFTIECFIRRREAVNSTDNQFLVGIIPKSGMGNPIGVQLYNNRWYFYTAAGTTPAGNYANPIGANVLWYHFALSVQGNTWRMFIDGVQIASVTIGNSHLAANAVDFITIGSNPNLNLGFFRWLIDELLITPTVAKYTAAFTPPTAPFV